MIEEQERQIQNEIMALALSIFAYFFEKSVWKSSTNWIFNLQKSVSKLIFVGYKAVKIQFEIDEKSSLLTLIFPTFFKIYQKYSTDG